MSSKPTPSDSIDTLKTSYCPAENNEDTAVSSDALYQNVLRDNTNINFEELLLVSKSKLVKLQVEVLYTGPYPITYSRRVATLQSAGARAPNARLGTGDAILFNQLSSDISHWGTRMAFKKIVLCLCLVHLVAGKGSEAQIECTPEYMKVSVPMDGDRKITYLDQLKDYAPCEPTIEGNSATFMLDLQDYHKCAVTRVLNKINGIRTYYHKVVIEDVSGTRETVRVRCVVNNKLKALAKRAVEPFPIDFSEPDVLNITRYMEGRAPEPILGAVVKQNGKQVSGEISVSPGTPLSMEIFLDNSSAPVYGLLVNYMHVTDTGKQQETIIFNGCSVDPYLFDNFLTSDGNNLTARFRAFKFPDTSYVLFKGTVTVCLDTCQGVQCSNGVTAYGRRRRSIAGSDRNKVYEVSLTTIIKVDWSDGHREEEDVLTLLKNLKAANQKLGDDEATVAQTSDRRLSHANGSSSIHVPAFLVLIVSLFVLFK